MSDRSTHPDPLADPVLEAAAQILSAVHIHATIEICRTWILRDEAFGRLLIEKSARQIDALRAKGLMK